MVCVCVCVGGGQQCVCMCVDVCVDMCVDVHVYECMCMCMCVHLHVYVHVYVHVDVDVHVNKLAVILREPLAHSRVSAVCGIRHGPSLFHVLCPNMYAPSTISAAAANAQTPPASHLLQRS